MVSQKTRSGASSLDRQFEWFFKVKGVKKEMRSPLWVAMDTANLLIASDNVRMRALQDVSWKLINMYLANVEMAAGAEEGRFRDVCVQTATALRASSLNNGVVELVVATIMHLREGTFDGLLETLHAAAGWYEGSKSRDRTGPWYSTWPTVNQFLPLTGRPIRGVIGIKYPQGPIERAANFSVAAATERAVARNLWTVGECPCCEWYEDNERIISVPFPERSGFNLDNRLIMDLVETGETGRKLFRSSPAMPDHIVNQMLVGVCVGGTCLTCGNIVTVGTDMEGVDDGELLDTASGVAQSPDVGGQGQEPGKGVSSGKRWQRGWGRQSHKHARKRKTVRGVVAGCFPLSLTDDVLSCSCLNGHHPAVDGWRSVSGYQAGYRCQGHIARNAWKISGGSGLSVRRVMFGGRQSCSASGASRQRVLCGRCRRSRDGVLGSTCINLRASAVRRKVTSRTLQNPSQISREGGGRGDAPLRRGDGGRRRRGEQGGADGGDGLLGNTGYIDGTIAGEPGRGGQTAGCGGVRFRPLTEGLWLRTLRGRRRRYRNATGAKLCTNFRACAVSLKVTSRTLRNPSHFFCEGGDRGDAPAHRGGGGRRGRGKKGRNKVGATDRGRRESCVIVNRGSGGGGGHGNGTDGNVGHDVCGGGWGGEGSSGGGGTGGGGNCGANRAGGSDAGAGRSAALGGGEGGDDARSEAVCEHGGERGCDGGRRIVAERRGEVGQHGGGAWCGGADGHLCGVRCVDAVEHAEVERRSEGGRRVDAERHGVREQHAGDERRLDTEQYSEGERHGQNLVAERRKVAGLHDGGDWSDVGAAHEVGELRSGGRRRPASALRGAREQHAGRAWLGGAVRFAGEGPEGGEREGGVLVDDAGTRRRGAGREAPARWTAASVPPA